MNLVEAIEVRRSRRAYLPVPLDPGVVEKLRQLIALYSQGIEGRIELVLDNGSAFEGLRKSYGMFSGVRHYIGLIGNKNNLSSSEQLGYYGQLLMLDATAEGLGSCWVSGSFDRKSCPFSLSEEESIISTVVVGKAVEHDSRKERLIRSLVHRKTKTAEEMFVADPPVPDWFLCGMKAVQKAPSAANRQPVTFSYQEGKTTAWVENLTDATLAVDLGIAKCNFEIGAGGGTWGWGNHAEFVRADT
ncbi:MAG: hypothetical protein FWG23_04835 [Eggerthellaceae bacterium]|jgi:nitroreductase|nr:hypothetical protein [Eggerthellaceae bacterium]MDR2715540.1 hypothetical protein [Coriobacteriaceae bacterium]